MAVLAAVWLAPSAAGRANLSFYPYKCHGVRVARLLLLCLQEGHHAVAGQYFATRNILSGTVIQGATLFSFLIEHMGPIYMRKFLEIGLNSQKDFTRNSETEMYGCGIFFW